MAQIDVTVAAIIERDGTFLTVEEMVGGQRVFNQPAGHLEIGESLEAAAVREVLEETGYAFQPQALLGFFLWQGEAGSFLRVAFIGSARPPHGEYELDEGIIAAHWLSRAELAVRADRLRSPMVLSCIDSYLEGRRYPLEAINAQAYRFRIFASPSAPGCSFSYGTWLSGTSVVPAMSCMSGPLDETKISPVTCSPWRSLVRRYSNALPRWVGS